MSKPKGKTPPQDGHTLVIFNQYYEGLRFYLVPNDVINDADRKFMRTLSGAVIGLTDLSEEEGGEVTCLQSWLTDHPEHYEGAAPAAELGRWSRYETDQAFIQADITEVIITGFVP